MEKKWLIGNWNVVKTENINNSSEQSDISNFEVLHNYQVFIYSKINTNHIQDSASRRNILIKNNEVGINENGLFWNIVRIDDKTIVLTNPSETIAFTCTYNKRNDINPIRDINEDRDMMLNIMKIAFTSTSIFETLNKQKIRYVIEFSEFLDYTRKIHWRIAVLELSKLFSPSAGDKHNLNLFFENCDTEYKNQILVPVPTLQLWRDRLKGLDDIIGKVKTIRDKVYAHTDLNSEAITEGLTEKDLFLLIDYAHFILNEVSTILGTGEILYKKPNAEIEDLEHFLTICQKRHLIGYAYSQIVDNHPELLPLIDMRIL